MNIFGIIILNWYIIFFYYKISCIINLRTTYIEAMETFKWWVNPHKDLSQIENLENFIWLESGLTVGNLD
jgi:hypothetical protein